MRRLAVVIVLVAVALGCKNPLNPSHSVAYRVSGSASAASMTYQASGGSTQQTGDRLLPWSYEFSAKAGDFVYVSAQNAGNSGCVNVDITVDGRLFKTATSCGAFVIATASGSIQ